MTSFEHRPELWQSLDQVNPYPTYSFLRSQPGLYFDEDERLFVASRYEDVDAILRDPKFSAALGKDFLLSSPDAAPALRAHYDKWMVFSSGPNHTVQRKLFSGRDYSDLSQSAVRAAILSVNFDEANTAGTDLVKILIDPLVGAYITNLLGLPSILEAQLRSLSTSLISPLNGRTDRVSLEKAAAAIEELHNIIELSPVATHGVISTLRSAIANCELSADHAVASLAQILTGAIEPAAFALGNALVALLTNRSELKLLIDTDVSVPEVIDELLRFDAPFQYVPRVAREGAMVAGTFVPKGVRVICLLASANHDHSEFEAGYELMLRRKPRRIAAFGLGPHACLGMRGAKELLAGGLEAFLAFCRTRPVELQSASRLASIGIRGFTSVLITPCK